MTNVELFESIVQEMSELYKKKNANYGDSFARLYQDLGPVAGLVPLYNKLHRASSLIKGGHNDFESLEDTFVDLANYAIMNIIELRRPKEIAGASVTPVRKILTEDIKVSGDILC